MNDPNKAYRVYDLVLEKREDECWPWKGRLNNKGYGTFDLEGRSVYGHRVMYELEFGPIPAGLEVMHTCHNTVCCNPKHLQLGTHKENMQDKKPYKLDTRNSSGTKGVYWSSTRNKWYAQAFANGKRIHLYAGTSYEEACEARREWEVDSGKES